MKENEKSPEQELVESVGLMLEKGMSASSKVYTGAIKSINGKKAKITINGQEQTVAVCTPEIAAGIITRVFVPDGNMSNAFIIGKQAESAATDPYAAKIQTGNYVGNGNTSYTRTINFNFSPRYVYIFGELTDSTTTGGSFIYPAKIGGEYMYTVTWGDKSLKFASSSTGFQAWQILNASGTTYYWVAIGVE